jgi:hypothetical protein
VEPNDHPNVLAYRVGQLESAVKAGFQEHNDKLDNIVNSFASKSDVTAVMARNNSLAR